VLSLVTLPPRMVMRALDDLHSLAVAARALPEIEARILARVAEIQEQFDQALEIGRSLDARGGELTALSEKLDAHAAAFLELSTGLDEMNRSAEAMAAVAEPLHGAPSGWAGSSTACRAGASVAPIRRAERRGRGAR
jgi:methyl-accepting chemotaxis protein